MSPNLWPYKTHKWTKPLGISKNTRDEPGRQFRENGTVDQIRHELCVLCYRAAGDACERDGEFPLVHKICIIVLVFLVWYLSQPEEVMSDEAVGVLASSEGEREAEEIVKDASRGDVENVGNRVWCKYICQFSICWRDDQKSTNQIHCFTKWTSEKNDLPRKYNNI